MCQHKLLNNTVDTLQNLPLYEQSHGSEKGIAKNDNACSQRSISKYRVATDTMFPKKIP